MIKVRRLYPDEAWVFLDTFAVASIMPLNSYMMRVNYKNGTAMYIDAITFE